MFIFDIDAFKIWNESEPILLYEYSLTEFFFGHFSFVELQAFVELQERLEKETAKKSHKQFSIVSRTVTILYQNGWWDKVKQK